jgi:hypothetical protein
VAEVTDEHRDELPGELDITGYVGPTVFPSSQRRRAPGVIYLVLGAACVAAWLVRRGGDPVLVNGGVAAAGIGLLLIGAYHLLAGWKLRVRETEALAAAVRTVGFPVGHASAQLGWQGLRSRPSWRILLYSADEPPKKRGIVLVDGVDGHVSSHFVEDNPESWN